MTNDQTVTQTLEPCPFCGNRDLFVSATLAGGVEWHMVECQNQECDIGGPPRKTEAEAITAWNTRTAHSGEGRKCGGALGSSGMRCALPDGHDGICAAKVRDDTEHGYCGAPPAAPSSERHSLFERKRDELRQSGEGRSNGAGEDALRRSADKFEEFPDFDPRALAVEIVDGIRGYTCEFAQSQREHEYWYDRVESLAARAALSAPQGEVQRVSAIDDIAAERRRQVDAEGWTPEHDDEHGDGSLAAAAATYAFSAATAERYLAADPIGFWPWAREWWKPSTPRRDLVKAGALIVAEIERLDRAALAQPEAGGEHE